MQQSCATFDEDVGLGRRATSQSAIKKSPNYYHNRMMKTQLSILTLTLATIGLSVAKNPTPTQILELLGSKGRDAGTKEELAAYDHHFDRIDQNKDGNLSHEEYVENAGYMTQQAREGIFRASDTNNDRSVSRQEYVLNRRITDEAKAIMAKMDKNGDRKISQKEFIEHSGIEDKSVAASIFKMLDTNSDGLTVTPEYLRVWGAWARQEDPNAAPKKN